MTSLVSGDVVENVATSHQVSEYYPIYDMNPETDCTGGVMLITCQSRIGSFHRAKVDEEGYGYHADTGDGGIDTAASGAWVFPDTGIRIEQGASGAWRAGSKAIPSPPPTKAAQEEPIGVAEQSVPE